MRQAVDSGEQPEAPARGPACKNRGGTESATLDGNGGAGAGAGGSGSGRPARRGKPSPTLATPSFGSDGSLSLGTLGSSSFGPLGFYGHGYHDGFQDDGYDDVLLRTPTPGSGGKRKRTVTPKRGGEVASGSGGGGGGGVLGGRVGKSKSLTPTKRRAAATAATAAAEVGDGMGNSIRGWREEVVSSEESVEGMVNGDGGRYLVDELGRYEDGAFVEFDYEGLGMIA